MKPVENARERIAKRVAQEFSRTDEPLYINTGVGIPTLVPDYVTNPNVYIQAENGLLGVGRIAEGEEIDDQLINASRQPIVLQKGAAFFDSAASFGMIRGGHIDATVIGALEVDGEGNIANWIIPGGKQLGVGGAMDLVVGCKRVIVAMQHCGKGNTVKIKKRCTLPVTGFGELDLLVTEYAVFSFDSGVMTLCELAPEITLEELKAITEADYVVSPDLAVLTD